MPKLVVKHHRPLQTGLIGAGIAVAAMLAVWAAFVYGEHRAGFDREAAGQLADALDQAEKHNAELSEQITVLQQQRDVDRNAREQVQASLQDMQHKLADTQEELGFYKGIVSPASGEEGIRVQTLKISNGGAPRLYHYRLVLIQARTRELRVSGNLDMKIYGVQAGKPLILDAHDIAPSGTPSLGFAFQYFQNLEGDVFFPEGFMPGRIEVTIHESGHGPVQQNFDWTSVWSGGNGQG